MTIRILDNDDLSTRRSGYDHSALAEQAMRHPGRWTTDDDDDVPQVTSTHIRYGRLAAYRPAGAFAIRRRTEGDRQRFDVRFLGVPIDPWTPGDGRSFGDLLRTFDPRKMPEGTPQHVVQIAEELLLAALDEAESKAEKKARKKKKAKKRKS